MLRKSGFDEDGYFATYRHAALVQALDISPFAVGTSYASFDEGELPEGLSPGSVIRTG